MKSHNSDRKIEKIISALDLENPIARLPKPLRFMVARKRYKWIYGLAALQHTPDDRRSLIETERLNTIFIHVPKAAGLSVAESLFSSHAAAHTPLYMYLALYGSRRFDRMFKFTFVRHPLERAVSAFKFLRKGGLTETDSEWAKTHLHKYQNIDDFICEGLHRDEIRSWVHFKPQTYFLRDPRTEKIGVDFVGRFENLGSDFEKVARQLGVDARLQHINQSTGSETRVSTEAKRIIEEIYNEDFNEFGY